MRCGIRIQPYLPADMFQRLRAYAAARSFTVSAVVVAAVGEYLDRDQVEDELIVRRLDGVTHAVEEVRRDVEALGVGFGRFVRYSFFSAPTTADAKVVTRAEALYRDFLSRVGEQFRTGVTFTGQVVPVRRRPEAAAIPALADGSTTGEGERP
jgi:hypothetical protein